MVSTTLRNIEATLKGNNVASPVVMVSKYTEDTRSRNMEATLKEILEVISIQL